METGGYYYAQSVVGYKYSRAEFYPYTKAYLETANYLKWYMKKETDLNNLECKERLFLPMCYLYRNFLEIGTDKDHVHFLVQSVPTYSPAQIAKIIKRITAREVLSRCPEVKKKLWGGNFWSSGYYVTTVSEHGNEDVIVNYVKNQGNEYKKLFRSEGMEGQITLFDM